MVRPVVKPDRLDELDAERFSDMVASPPFALLWKRVLAELRRSCDACSAASEPLEVYRAQGRVAAYKAVLDMPATILSEIRAKKRT